MFHIYSAITISNKTGDARYENKYKHEYDSTYQESQNFPSSHKRVTLSLLKKNPKNIYKNNNKLH